MLRFVVNLVKGCQLRTQNREPMTGNGPAGALACGPPRIPP